VILLWGTMDDEPMAMAHAALMKARAEFLFLDHRTIFTADVDYAFDPERGARCSVMSGETALDMARVKVAYVRGSNLYDYDDARDLPKDSPVAMRAARFEAQLMAWLDASDTLTINRSGPSATNNSKPYQMTLIRQAGFSIPETLVSNDAVAVKAFLTEHPDAVYKSISGVRSIVRPVGERHRDFLDDVQWCPTLFQRVVRGTNYRAHVIGNDVLAVRIESDRLDYRYGSSTITIAELPAGVSERCRRLTASLGLYFSGIDLIRTPQSEWYCLEVNPSPAFSYFELGSGQPIGAALAQFMIDADNLCSR
jgi:glutathione synthase/RimK-type ligase-like ATP-grasp enzyme